MKHFAKYLGGLAMSAACLLAGAAEMPHSIEYRILGDKLYIVANDLNGDMVGISEQAIDGWPVGMGIPDRSYELNIGSAGGPTESTATVAYSDDGCGDVRVETTTEAFETEKRIIVITPIKVYCDDELLDVFVSRIKVPKPESPDPPGEQ
ncbi:MAG: hypothetical protein OXP36_09435 [Gammaproteobacteria bacterium]|nr:hypothetical protein [Gammaproteobacteria bacterium]